MPQKADGSSCTNELPTMPIFALRRIRIRWPYMASLGALAWRAVGHVAAVRAGGAAARQAGAVWSPG
jgi:hypothetical protein